MTELSGQALTALPEDTLVWDNHGCLPFRDIERWLPSLSRYREARVHVASINVGDALEPLETLVRTAAAIRAFVRAHPAEYLLAESVDAIESARRTNRLAVALDVEGAAAIGDQISLIGLLFDIGVRWMSMVYNRRNLVGSGCHDAVDDGLTEFGRRVVREMDRVGMVKCCSHTGYRTAMEVFQASDKPAIFSHSNPLRLRNHPRNIPDELIDACAATGGVVCVNGVGIFLGENDASVATLADHMEYVARRVGAGHVGIGLDYVFDQNGLAQTLRENAAVWPEALGYRAGIRFVPPEGFGQLAVELARRGWSKEDLRAVLGGNLLRVAREVWK